MGAYMRVTTFSKYRKDGMGVPRSAIVAAKKRSTSRKRRAATSRRRRRPR